MAGWLGSRLGMTVRGAVRQPVLHLAGPEGAEYRFGRRSQFTRPRTVTFLPPGWEFTRGRRAGNVLAIAVGEAQLAAEIEARAVKFALKRPYRCPPAVQALADAYVDGGWGDGAGRFEAAAQGLADGTSKVVVCGDGEPEAHAAVGREIRAAKKQGFAEREIAVVSLRGMMHPGNVMRNPTLGRCELAQATDLAHRERVVCDTFLRYKGLERPMIIVGDVSPDSSRYPVRMNIAVSRAFGALRIVVSRGELEKDPVLKRLAESGASVDDA